MSSVVFHIGLLPILYTQGCDWRPTKKERSPGMDCEDKSVQRFDKLKSGGDHCCQIKVYILYKCMRSIKEVTTRPPRDEITFYRIYRVWDWCQTYSITFKKNSKKINLTIGKKCVAGFWRQSHVTGSSAHTLTGRLRVLLMPVPGKKCSLMSTLTNCLKLNNILTRGRFN